MGDLFGMLFFRDIIRFVGLRVRYLWFKAIGKPRSLKSLSNVMKDDYEDMGKAVTQDILNALVGTPVTILIILIIVYIVYR
jgi:hypothetical protein